MIIKMFTFIVINSINFHFDCLSDYKYFHLLFISTAAVKYNPTVDSLLVFVMMILYILLFFIVHRTVPRAANNIYT